MNLYQYQNGIKKFAQYPVDKELEYLTLGLCNEIGEFYEKVLYDNSTRADLISELGDCLWYATMLYSHFNIALTFNIASNRQSLWIWNPMNNLIIQSALIAGKVKKHMRDNATVIMQTHLEECIKYIYILAHGLDIDLEQLAEYNYNKLEDRYQRGVIKGSGDLR